MEKFLKDQSGQALIVVLLVMAVALTIGLSIVSRSITDIRISQSEEESARAFSVAEAGLEEALNIEGETTFQIDGVSVNVEKVSLGGSSHFDFGGAKFAQGDIQTIWLVEHVDGVPSPPSFPSNGSIELCWDDPGPSVGPGSAIEASLIYEYNGAVRVARLPLDPHVTRGNHFNNSDIGINGCAPSNLRYSRMINLQSDFKLPPSAFSPITLWALRLKLLYNDVPQPIAVVGSQPLPGQGNCYDSTARVEESGITRRIQQCRFYESPPGVFDYLLFSEGSLEKGSFVGPDPGV